jgi:hypothetical protein
LTGAGSFINGLSVSFDQAATTADVAAPAHITIGTMFKDKAQYLAEWLVDRIYTSVVRTVQ